MAKDVVSQAKELCLIEVGQILKEKLTAADKKALNKKIDDLYKKYANEPTSDAVGIAVAKHLAEDLKQTKILAAIEERNTYLNHKAFLKLREKQVVWSKNKAEGLSATIAGSLADQTGSKTGIMGVASARENASHAALMSDLVKGKLLDVATSGKLDDEIYTAAWHLNTETPDESVLKTLPKEAVEIAKIFRNHQERARLLANKHGANIGARDNWVFRQSHDQLRIAKAKGLLSSQAENQAFWVSKVKEYLSPNAFADVADEAELTGILNEMWVSLASGSHTKHSGAVNTGLPGLGNIGKKLSHERVLVFKDAKSELEYFKLFGSGSVIENVVRGVRKLNRDAALMENLGPNAKLNLAKLFDEVQESARGDLKELEAVRKMRGTLERNYLPVLFGELSAPENVGGAAASAMGRALMSMRSLGAAVLSALPDIATFGSTVRSYSERDVASMFSGMGDVLDAVLKGRLKEDDLRLVAGEMGVMLDVLASPHTVNSPDSMLPGAVAKATQTYFKLNGLSYWQDRVRLASVLGTAHRFAAYSGKKMGALSEGAQALFRQFGISENDWDSWRSTEKFKWQDGEDLLTVDAIRRQDISHFVNNPDVKARIADMEASAVKKYTVLTEQKTALDEFKASPEYQKKVDKILENYREELANKAQVLVSEFTAMATSEPGEVERAMMLMGTKAGTGTGELIRHAMQLKSFTVSIMRKHIGRELHGYRAERISTGKALMSTAKELFTIFGAGDKSSIAGMANLVVTGTLLGYASLNLKRIAKGQKPLIPQDAKQAGQTLLASAAQSGSFGIYGDFLLGDAVKTRMGHSPVGTLMGPTFGLIEDVANIYAKAREGKDIGATTFNFVLNNTPIVGAAYNHFLVRTVADNLIMYRMQEAMNPGYLRRMEKRMKKDLNREFIIPPSTYIPYGGGF